MFAGTLAVAALALFGHIAFWIGLVNRWHATGLPRKLVKSVTLVFYAALLGPLLGLAWLAIESPRLAIWPSNCSQTLCAYAVSMAAYGAAHLAMWSWQTWRARHPPGVRLVQQHVVHVARQLGASPARGSRAVLLSRIPGNQIWRLHVSDYRVELPNLPPALDGLTLCHLSDLHLSGRIDRGYFDEVVRQTNAMQADLIAVTGDICDAARCIDWIPKIFSPAQARLGKYFVLGNHDLRSRDIPRLRGALREAGFVDLGGRSELIGQGKILLAGDERPWFKTEPVLPDFAAELPFKVLLAHTPDRFTWARQRGFDLMLAGHTHGGQIRLPLVGPVICPSLHGTRYSAGFFRAGPTLLHVSRGTASLFPVRLLCPPEMTRIVLRASGAR